ncbi:MAG: arsenic resistance protein [Candidatus Helarchaeota archaeon]
MESEKDDVAPKEKSEQEGLSKFEKFLPLWIAICIAAGVIISITIPGISIIIDSLQIRWSPTSGISIPIAICLFIMMYPAMLNIQISELKKLGKNPLPIILTLVSNWLVAPFIGAALAAIFLPGLPELKVAVILLASSPCTAMVLVWGYLAEGNQEQNVITTSVNTITIIIGYVPLVAFLTGIQSIPVDRVSLLISLIIFIGCPLVLGITSKKILIKKKGEEWFNDVYRPAVGKIAIAALLMTLVVLFSMNGTTLIFNPDKLILVSIPLLVGFAMVVGYNLIVTKLVRLKYREAVITVIIGSSSHFEIAIATAISIYGLGSLAALGTTMGLFWEVPIMLSLVYLGKFLRRKRFWLPNENNGEKSIEQT